MQKVASSVPLLSEFVDSGPQIPRVDVIVVGGGLSGLVTTLELLKRGRSVLLIDRDEIEKLGGMARDSFGGITMFGTPEQRRAGIRDSQELGRQDWLRAAEFESNDHWPRQWVDQYAERSMSDIYEWLTRQGVKFFPVVHWVERGWVQPGNSIPRFHMVWGTGHGLVESIKKTLSECASRSGLKIWPRTKVDRLLFEGQKVVGVSGSRDVSGQSVPFEIRASAVVLAAGGICGDLDLVRKHWDPRLGKPPGVLLNGAHRFADGTLHEAAREIGAKITHLEKQWNYAGGIADPEDPSSQRGLSLVPPKSALWLGPDGTRIGPEPLVSGFDTRHLVASLMSNQWEFSWQLLNYKIALKELAISGARHNPAIRDRKWLKFLWNILRGNRELVDEMLRTSHDFVVASSLPELVDKMRSLEGGEKINFENVKNAVQNWDGMIRRGPRYFNDAQMRRILHARQYRGDRVRTCKAQEILDPKAGPLIAIRERLLTRKTLGGLQTDLQSRALDQSGKVIDGLWAVGETAGFGGGGIHGTGALEGTFLGSCILTAQSAARSI